MLRTILKSGLHPIKHKPKSKQERNNTKSNLPPHLQSFKQKPLSGNGFFNIKMSLEDFQLIDKEPLDKSNIKGDCTKTYHRQGGQLNQSDQNIECIFGEKNNYHQIGNAYLEFNITVRKNDDTNLLYDDSVRLVNNGYAFCFKEARSSTTIGSEIEINNFLDKYLPL